MRLLTIRKREVPPAQGVGLEPIQPQISNFWALTYGNGIAWTPQLQERVWTASRCLHLTCQQIASMPLRFFGSYRPAWVGNPDPVWFPNGIGDAVYAITHWQLAYGDAFLHISSRYPNGYPSGWTVLDSSQVTVRQENGRRTYKYGQTQLDPANVVQITRNPTGKLTGSSTLAAYAAQLWGLASAGELGHSMVANGGIPNAVLKSSRRLSPDQAEAIQTGWVDARMRSALGAPAILPPELTLEQTAFNAVDMALLQIQEFDARAIAAAFGIPAFMLNMPLEGGLTYQNPETLFEVWWRSELQHIAQRIQDALTANMLPRGNRVEFESRAALAPTFQDQVTAWLALKEAGIVTESEVRAVLLHLAPLSEGEALDELTEQPIAAASPADQNKVQQLRPLAGGVS